MTFAPTRQDQELLITLAEHRALTCRQLALLARRNLRALRRRVRELAVAGLVQRASGRPNRKAGRPDFIISVSGEGAALLSSEGHLEVRADLGDVVAPRGTVIAHQLLVNEFRVGLAEMERCVREVSVRFMSPNSPFVPQWEPGGSILRERIKTPDGQRIELIPDGAISVTHAKLGKALLFFLEADMGSETLASGRGRQGDLWHKIVKYQCYFQSGRYQRYEAILGCPFKGFRLLILTNTRARRDGVCSLLRDMSAPDFVLVADLPSIVRAGVWGNVWFSGGRTDVPSVSILGSKMPKADPRARPNDTSK